MDAQGGGCVLSGVDIELAGWKKDSIRGKAFVTTIPLSPTSISRTTAHFSLSPVTTPGLSPSSSNVTPAMARTYRPRKSILRMSVCYAKKRGH